MGKENTLNNLRMDTGVRCLFLFSPEGYLVDCAGNTNGLDIEAIGALVAAEFAAAAALAVHIGNQLTFLSNYHEGEDYSMYIHGMKDGLLVSIFETGSNLGIVRYYTQKTIDQLEKTLSTGILPPLDRFIDEAAFTDYVDSSIDQLFDSSDR